MDYASGVVGSSKRKISYIGIREHLEYLPLACSRDKPIKVTLDKARGLISRLESLGVIVAVHSKSVRGCMVFFLPLARPELVCAQDEAHMRPTSQTPILEGIVDKLEGDEAHTSLYLTTLNLNNNITREDPEVSNGKIPSGWLPSIDMVNQLVMDFGFTSKFIEQVAFMFRIYWSDRGGMASSWNIKFYNHVKGRVQDRAPEFIEALVSEPARH